MDADSSSMRRGKNTNKTTDDNILKGSNMAIRECNCKEFQDSGHTDECNEHYKPAEVRAFESLMTAITGCKFVDVTPKTDVEVE